MFVASRLKEQRLVVEIGVAVSAVVVRFCLAAQELRRLTASFLADCRVTIAAFLRSFKAPVGRFLQDFVAL